MGPGVDAGIVFLGTMDLEATSAFYTRHLGLSMVLDQERCRIFRVARGAFVGFCLRETVDPDPGVILTLVSDEVEAWATRLRDRGIRLEREPTHQPEYRIFHLFVRDPNGYLVEIQRFDDPHWSEL
jgi:catechol 2,3-dioxygenase-like lactoylglutathione lyase family enzyme